MKTILVNNKILCLHRNCSHQQQDRRKIDSAASVVFRNNLFSFMVSLFIQSNSKFSMAFLFCYCWQYNNFLFSPEIHINRYTNVFFLFELLSMRRTVFMELRKTIPCLQTFLQITIWANLRVRVLMNHKERKTFGFSIAIVLTFSVSLLVILTPSLQDYPERNFYKLLLFNRNGPSSSNKDGELKKI